MPEAERSRRPLSRIPCALSRSLRLQIARLPLDATTLSLVASETYPKRRAS